MSAANTLHSDRKPSEKRSRKPRYSQEQLGAALAKAQAAGDAAGSAKIDKLLRRAREPTAGADQMPVGGVEASNDEIAAAADAARERLDRLSGSGGSWDAVKRGVHKMAMVSTQRDSQAPDEHRLLKPATNAAFVAVATTVAHPEPEQHADLDPELELEPEPQPQPQPQPEPEPEHEPEPEPEPEPLTLTLTLTLTR